ncbi:DUF6261 family protein [Marinifilum flexuosum]|uniref:DUF6261 family protein n=1 Tax=Marinifilum flexuosum TaxID=1117708 RepID=UPI002493480E|nr:DUF6261 family protein [Marinifilum flexuosum]
MEKILSKIDHKIMSTLCNDMNRIKLNSVLEEDTYFMGKLSAIKELTEKLIDKTNEEWRTKRVRKFDNIRNTDLRAIFYLVEAYSYRREDDKKQSALKLKEILDRFGLQIIKKSYIDKSSSTRALLVQLKSEKLKNDRNQIADLDQLISNLEQSQQDYYNALSLQMEDDLKRKNSKPAHILSMKLRKLINEEFAPYIHAMKLADKEAYVYYSKKLSSIIESYNTEVRNHQNYLKRKKQSHLTSI